MSKTSPLPWKTFIKGRVVEIRDANDRVVILWTGFDGSDTSLSRQRDNARRIVKAVNSYDSDAAAKE